MIHIEDITPEDLFPAIERMWKISAGKIRARKEAWDPANGAPLRTCTIITVEPNTLMAPIHDRMPAILRPEDEAAWLDVSARSVPAILAMLKPYPAEDMEAYPVGRRVNSPAVDKPGCIEPLAP